MAKFKVGDRVMMKFNTGRITRITWNEFGYKSAEPAVVAAVDNGDIYFKYHVLLDNKNPTDHGYWWAAESELSPLAPAIPDGWTPASEPPSGDTLSAWGRNVRVLLSDGRKWYGWRYEHTGRWFVYDSDVPEATLKSYPNYGDNFTEAAPSEVLAWREIEPKPAAKARYVVCAIHTEHDTLEEAELHAQRTVESLHVNVVIARVVEEVKPGKPEIIRMEE